MKMKPRYRLFLCLNRVKFDAGMLCGDNEFTSIGGVIVQASLRNFVTRPTSTHSTTNMFPS